jgi:hypothetical protein
MADLPLHPATEATPDNHGPDTAIPNKREGATGR